MQVLKKMCIKIIKNMDEGIGFVQYFVNNINMWVDNYMQKVVVKQHGKRHIILRQKQLLLVVTDNDITINHH